MSWLNIFGSGRAKRRGGSDADMAPQEAPGMAPDQPFCAVGDIHGCADLAEDLYQQLRNRFGADIPVVFVGDYVDRGPGSKQVLDRLIDRSSAGDDKVVCLLGNHEKMLLEFIDDPLGRGLRWLSHGGVETLQSYGLGPVPKGKDPEEIMALADAFEERLGATLAWLRARPMRWSSGSVHCVHAAMDPQVAPEDQTAQSLLWGHRAFLSEPRQDGATVVHGHTIVRAPGLKDGRVSIDIGAYKTGRLCAAHIDQGRCEFVIAGAR